VADEAVLNIVRKKTKNPPKNMKKILFDKALLGIHNIEMRHSKKFCVAEIWALLGITYL
jgi:hypothetical protein